MGEQLRRGQIASHDSDMIHYMIQTNELIMVNDPRFFVWIKVAIDVSCMRSLSSCRVMLYILP